MEGGAVVVVLEGAVVEFGVVYGEGGLALGYLFGLVAHYLILRIKYIGVDLSTIYRVNHDVVMM